MAGQRLGRGQRFAQGIPRGDAEGGRLRRRRGGRLGSRIRGGRRCRCGGCGRLRHGTACRVGIRVRGGGRACCRCDGCGHWRCRLQGGALHLDLFGPALRLIAGGIGHRHGDRIGLRATRGDGWCRQRGREVPSGIDGCRGGGRAQLDLHLRSRCYIARDGDAIGGFRPCDDLAGVAVELQVGGFGRWGLGQRDRVGAHGCRGAARLGGGGLDGMLAILQACEVQARFPEAIGTGPDGGCNLRARHLYADVGVGFRRARHFHAIGFHGIDHVVICDLAIHGGLAGDGRCALDRHVQRGFGRVAGLVGGGYDQRGFGRAIGGRGGNVGGRNRDPPVRAHRVADGDGLAVPGGRQRGVSLPRRAKEGQAVLRCFCREGLGFCETGEVGLGRCLVDRELVVGRS